MPQTDLRQRVQANRNDGGLFADVSNCDRAATRSRLQTGTLGNSRRVRAPGALARTLEPVAPETRSCRAGARQSRGQRPRVPVDRAHRDAATWTRAPKGDDATPALHRTSWPRR